MTMSTGDTAHAGHTQQWRSYRTWGQVDDTFTIWSRACNPLRRAFADEQAITRTTNIFLSWWSISNWLQQKVTVKNERYSVNRSHFLWFYINQSIKRIDFTYSCFIALRTFHDVLLLLPWNVYKSLANSTGHNHVVLLIFSLIGRWDFIGTDGRSGDGSTELFAICWFYLDEMSKSREKCQRLMITYL